MALPVNTMWCGRRNTDGLCWSVKWQNAAMVKNIEGVSFYSLRKEFPALKSRLPTLWTNSYFVSRVREAPLSVIIIQHYVEKQKNV
jgi:REP element-mobilizing transposase RayT